MSVEGSSIAEDEGRSRFISIWVGPPAILVALWLWFAFSSGGYTPEQWLPPTLLLGLLGVVVSVPATYPRRPQQLSSVVLGLCACYCIWVAVSAVWADSISRVWMESGRTFGYLLILALALVYFTDPAARRMFRYLLMAAGLVLLVACLWQLWGRSDIAGLFIEDRFSYPVSYPNNAGALFLVAFWPLMWLAAGPEERAPVRGVALGLATGLLGLAIMTQSRGALWSLALSLVIVFAISPARMRTWVYLLVPALLMVYEFPKLNRYWLEGPVAVGGGVGARTLVVAAITAAFMGMILALLERWVKVSRKATAIIGTVVLVAVLAGSIYGAFTLTRDAGGPAKWLSQTWRQFSGQTTADSDSAQESRFTMISSSGRVDIWKVACQEFRDAPALGVGADNFVFKYDRLRAHETSKPQQAHSLELQILGETGAVGGVFAFGSILVVLGGLLWPRYTAGYLGARDSWLRRRRRTDAPEDGSRPDQASKADAPFESEETSTPLNNSRWGTDPRAYGWEMALLAGAAYWLIHASVDWLWQMAGVTIPALLFVAAAVAGIDARAGVLWPRASRWLKLSPRRRETRLPTDSGPELLPDPEQEQPPQRLPYRRRVTDRLQPPGLLSAVFRALLVALSLLVLITAGLPYLSIQFQKSAVALAGTDGGKAVRRAGSARFLVPGDPRPYLTQAGIYSRAAYTAAASETDDRAGAVLDDLALSIDRLEAAIAREPADWSIRYRAGVATLNLLLAGQYAAGLEPELDYATLIPTVPGLEDWSALVSVSLPLPPPGAAAGSLVANATSLATATKARDLSRDMISEIAAEFLRAAHERNPLAPQPVAALEVIEQLSRQ